MKWVKRKITEYHYSLECSECFILGHDSQGIRSWVFTQVGTFLRWLNEKKTLSRCLQWSTGDGWSALRLYWWRSPECHGKQCWSTEKSLQGFILLCLLPCLHLCFSLDVVFVLRLLFFISMGLSCWEGSLLSWCGYQAGLLLTCADDLW